MAQIDTAAALAQRVSDLLSDSTVQDELRRAGRSSRDAYRRTKRKKRKRSAARDPLIQYRVREAISAAAAVARVAREDRERRRRRRRRLVVAALATGGVIATATSRRQGA